MSVVNSVPPVNRALFPPFSVAILTHSLVASRPDHVKNFSISDFHSVFFLSSVNSRCIFIFVAPEYPTLDGWIPLPSLCVYLFQL